MLLEMARIASSRLCKSIPSILVGRVLSLERGVVLLVVAFFGLRPEVLANAFDPHFSNRVRAWSSACCAWIAFSAAA